MPRLLLLAALLAAGGVAAMILPGWLQARALVPGLDVHDADPAADAALLERLALLAARLPAFSLQPIVENAIKHGLEPKTGGGPIWILARRHDDHATLTVADVEGFLDRLNLG